MTFLPIVDRELRVSARLPGTYRVRVIAGLGTVLMLGLLYWEWNRSAAPFTPGSMAFTVLTTIAMFYCTFEGARATSDAVSEEKREGTLGLLFLTDLNGHDVILGKLAASSLNSLYGLIAIFPIIAISLLMGGVTGGEFWRVNFVLANTLFLSLAAGLWVSVRHKDAHRAARHTIGLMILINGLPLLVDEVMGRSGSSKAILSVLSPAFTCLMGHANYYTFSPGRFWAGNLCIQIFAWSLLVAASRTVLGHWRTGFREDVPARATQKRWWSFRLERNRKALLDRHPFAILAKQIVKPDRLLWICGFVAVAGSVWLARGPRNSALWGAAMVTATTAGWLLKLASTSHASQPLVQSRENGAIEILLTTPLSPAEIVRGNRVALRSILGWTVLVGALLAMLSYYAQAAQLRTMPMAAGPNPNYELLFYFGFSAFTRTVVFAFDVIALSWVVMWMALRIPGHNRVVATAFLFVIVIPWLASLPLNLRGVTISGYNWIPWCKIPAMYVAKDIAFIFWARAKLRRFRWAVSQ